MMARAGLMGVDGGARRPATFHDDRRFCRKSWHHLIDTPACLLKDYRLLDQSVGRPAKASGYLHDGALAALLHRLFPHVIMANARRSRLAIKNVPSDESTRRRPIVAMSLASTSAVLVSNGIARRGSIRLVRNMNVAMLAGMEMCRRVTSVVINDCTGLCPALCHIALALWRP